MIRHEEEYVKNRPQELCKMCGKCCRVITNTQYTYDEICEMASQGNEYAKDFIKIFKPYNSIEDAKKVDKETVENIINRLKDNETFNPDTITFYGCKYILPDNSCPIYEERPALCRVCPSSGWAITPPGCGFTAWQFLRREEDKSKIRKAKEELLELKIMRKKTTTDSILKKIDSVERKIYNNIEMYAPQGSHDW